MQVRDAVEDDAETLASMSETPTDAMVNMIHDRTVRVAIADDTGGDAEDTESSDDSDTTVGFVSFDAHVETVHVTQLAGTDTDVCRQLLDEPISFARGEGMTVELLIPSDDEALVAAAEQAGFEDTGTGPRFDTHPTVKFRLDP